MKTCPKPWSKAVRPLSAGIFGLSLLMIGAGAASAERVDLTWVVESSGAAYEVSSPASVPLHALKRRVMAESGIGPGNAPAYQVERTVMVETEIPSRTGIGYVSVEETQVLDENQSLAALGLGSGDTLRLSPVVTEADSRPGKGRGR